MKVKLITVWQGPMPPWQQQFAERLRANPIIDWHPVLVQGPQGLNRLMKARLGLECRKDSVYAQCDLRPLFGHLFAKELESFQWWGWLDMDVVLGDLQRLLPPLLENHDIISTDGDIIHGPLTLMRNCDRVNRLYRNCMFEDILAEPEYCNFDETGFNEPLHLGANSNPSLSQIVHEKQWNGLSVWHDDRSWTESHDTLIDGIPSRCCDLQRGKLVEIPTKRELLLYHFTSKRWPLPNRYWDCEQLQKKNLHSQAATTKVTRPVESSQYWEERVQRQQTVGGEIHRCVLDTPIGDWHALHAKTAKTLSQLLCEGDCVLDAGCGFGALTECLPEGVIYKGIDYCSGMLDLARSLYPNRDFVWGDLKELPYLNDCFDWAICRGVEGTAKTLLGYKVWAAMRQEMLRVAKRILLIDTLGNWRIVER